MKNVKLLLTFEVCGGKNWGRNNEETIMKYDEEIIDTVTRKPSTTFRLQSDLTTYYQNMFNYMKITPYGFRSMEVYLKF